MQFISIQKCVLLIPLIFLFTKVQAAIIPLPPANPNPALNSFTNFDWSDSVNQTFTIDVDEPARVHVTDLNYQGKGISVYDNETFLGETATVITKENPYGADEYNYRQGFFNLDNGHHVISVRLNDPTEKGTGIIRVIPGWNKETMVIVPTNITEANNTSFLTENGTAVLNNAATGNNTEIAEGNLPSSSLNITETEGEKSTDQEQVTKVNDGDVGKGDDEKEDNEEECDYENDEDDEEENSNNDTDEQLEDINSEDGENTEGEGKDTESGYGNTEHCRRDYLEIEQQNGNITASDPRINDTNNETISYFDDDCKGNDDSGNTTTSIYELNEEPYTVTLTSTIIVNVYRTEPSDNSEPTTVN